MWPNSNNHLLASTQTSPLTLSDLNLNPGCISGAASQRVEQEAGL